MGLGARRARSCDLGDCLPRPGAGRREGTDLSQHGPDYRDFVAAQMNHRPGEALGWCLWRERSAAYAVAEVMRW